MTDKQLDRMDAIIERIAFLVSSFIVTFFLANLALILYEDWRFHKSHAKDNAASREQSN